MNTSPPANICVLGSINMDLVVRSPRLPSPGETLLGGSFSAFPGGKGANQAVAAARAGALATMIGMVGHDAHGQRLRRELADNAVGDSGVATDDHAPTGVGLITVGENSSENTIVVAPGANARLTPAHVESVRELIAAADVLLVQLEVPMDAVVRAAQVASQSGATVMVNAAPAAPLPWELLDAADVVIVNQNEAARVIAHATVGGDAGEVATRPVDEQLDAIERLGVGCAVITLGSHGAAFSRARECRRVPAFEVTAADTVGAGDAFCGYFAARYAEHRAAASLDADALTDTVTWACAAGALAATRHGAIPSLPRRDEVVRLLCRR
ncbi:MAG: ribokinase [Phycisphaeraceae bacterium]|nr:ribokinase [Phycisphaeraceae bacterium]